MEGLEKFLAEFDKFILWYLQHFILKELFLEYVNRQTASQKLKTPADLCLKAREGNRIKIANMEQGTNLLCSVQCNLRHVGVNSYVLAVAVRKQIF